MTYKESFIKFMEECGVLTFGDFTLKSGRKAPYFINCGNYKTGSQLARLGEYYAECIHENNIPTDVLFGPAYKGIPLAVSAVIALSNKYGLDNISYCFDRKEVKDHGEGGAFVGKSLKDGDRVIIIDDVMTSGKALRESLPKIKSVADVNITGMVITVDRMEKGTGELSAVQEVKRDFGVTVYSIVTMEDIINAIRDGLVGGKQYLDSMLAYREKYGVK